MACIKTRDAFSPGAVNVEIMPQCSRGRPQSQTSKPFTLRDFRDCGDRQNVPALTQAIVFDFDSDASEVGSLLTVEAAKYCEAHGKFTPLVSADLSPGDPKR